MRDNITEAELHQVIKRLERFADLTDTKFRIPGTNIPIGLDAIIGLIPVFGEVVGALMSFYVLREAHKLGVPTSLKIRMLANVAVDFVIGLIPILGDFGDIAFRSNLRNIKLILQHIETHRREERLALDAQPTTQSNKKTLFFLLLFVTIFGVGLFLFLIGF